MKNVLFVVLVVGVASALAQVPPRGYVLPAGEDHKISTRAEPMELVEFPDRPGLDDEFRADIEEPLTLEKLNKVANRYGTVYRTLE